MPAPVLLPDIVEALEIQFDESYSFLDLEMGQVETISAELLRKAEESEEDDDADVLDWQKREWEIAKRIISTDRFRKLATKFDVLEWAIMEDFARSVTSDRIRNDLLNAIHGAGAFRHFKETLRRHRIEPAWFTFRDDALRQIAIEWCEEHRIQYVEQI